MGRILPLRNTVQEYAWGSFSHLQDLLSLPLESRKRPMAELWMGAHPSAPSYVDMDGRWIPLDRLIERNPGAILGDPPATAFHGRLPFLFKVLAVGHPLSVQVHPNEIQAQEGFEKENLAGLDSNHPHRSYRDPYGKPELLCALTPFQALKGIRPLREMLDMLERISPRSLRDEIRDLEASPSEEGIRRFWSKLMVMGPERRSRVTQEALESTKDAKPGTAMHWVGRLASIHPGDMGLLSPALLNWIALEPGEALYVHTGDLHVYLEGMGLELMGNSDNVIRGGLTPKHVDPDELMCVADFRPSPAGTAETMDFPHGETVYASPAREFCLSRIEVRPGRDWKSAASRGVDIVLVVEGRGELQDLGRGDILPVAMGDAVLVPASLEAYTIRGEAVLARASVPAPRRKRVFLQDSESGGFRGSGLGLEKG